MNKHCCEQMSFFIEEGKITLGYNSVYREYFIELKHTNGKQLIHYCPWCGTALPESLRNKWFDILEEQYNIDDPLEDEHKIPEEFKSDAWWNTEELQ